MNAITTAQESTVRLAENPAKLLQAWQQLQAQHAGPMPLRARDAAEKLGVSEAQLVASRCGQGVTRLKGEWQDLVMRLPSLGYLMSLVRNNSIVHERKGEYGKISFEGHGGKIGVVANDNIELRIFLYRWDSVFAISDTLADGNKRLSLQFFDKHGTAIQKIFLTQKSDKKAYEKIVQDFLNSNQDASQTIQTQEKSTPTRPDVEIDLEGLRKNWAELKDTHDFYPMLKKFNVGREQALRLGGQHWATPVSNDTVGKVLNTASQNALPLMIFVGNDNIVQIHTGIVQNIKPIHGWLNILDEEFNLHICEKDIHHSWIVRKPTVDGIVTSLELYDKSENLIVTFFGKRKPGIPEDHKWRELAERMTM